MDRRFLNPLYLLLACAALVGCVPQKNADLPLPKKLDNAALFDCADATVRELHSRDEQWKLSVTQRDVADGRFETGHFDEPNVMGYRMRLVRRGAEPRATLGVRAAGPYFTDLGAERALIAFQTTLSACIARGTPDH